MPTQTAVTEPHTYAESERGKGHIYPIEPTPFNRRIYAAYLPYVVWADGHEEVLDEERNLGTAVWRLRLALGLDT